MEKKIRVTLPTYIYKVILEDIEDFDINKNKLCNLIYSHLKGEKLDLSPPDTNEKSTLQFNLNKKNLEEYYHVLEERSVQVEARFFRNIYYTYANKPKGEREALLHKGHISSISYSIEEKKTLKLIFKDGKIAMVTPYYIGSSSLQLANYIFSYDHTLKEYRNYRLSNIKTVFISKEDYYLGDSSFISGVIKNFDPFLSRGKRVTVKFSKGGLIMLDQLKTNRPKIIEESGDTITFECSKEKAKRYFTYFLSNAKITEPKDLATWFKMEFLKAYQNYK